MTIPQEDDVDDDADDDRVDDDDEGDDDGDAVIYDDYLMMMTILMTVLMVMCDDTCPGEGSCRIDFKQTRATASNNIWVGLLITYTMATETALGESGRRCLREVVER